MARAEGPAQGLGFLPACGGSLKQKMTRSVILQENPCSGSEEEFHLQPRPVTLWETVLDGERAGLSPLGPLSSTAAKKP